MPEKIAFIGLGIMGKPMAHNLLKAGHKIFTYARNRKNEELSIEMGAIPCPTPKDAVEQARFCIVMVSDTADVEEVTIKHSDSIIHGASKGSIIIDMSTISPVATRQIAARLGARGIDFLDAPVSGGEQGAIDGTLSIMVGGLQETFQSALPLLKILGGNIVRIGNHGAGQIAKACNQLIVAQTMIAVAEAFEFAAAADVDPAQVRQALLGGFAYSRILETHGEKMLTQNYTPGFKARLHLKDLKNTAATADSMNIELTGTALAYKYLVELIENGHGESDSAAIAKVVRAHCRTERPHNGSKV